MNGHFRFSVCLTALLISSATIAVAETPFAPVERVEPGILAELRASADGTAYAMVILKAPPGAMADVEAGRFAIDQMRQRVLAKLARDEFHLVYQFKYVPAMTGRLNQAGLDKLSKDPEVLRIGPDMQGEGHLSTSVPFINADDVQSLGYTGTGMTVAVLDTGIDTDHPDLSDDIAAGAWHFLNGGADTGAGAEDDNGHGTNVSGIITSRGTVAPVGVAPNADILAVKVLDASSSGFLSDWVAGVDYVVSVRGNYTHLSVINMSLGSFALSANCPCDNDNASNMALQASILAARSVGIATFCSSGNQGSCTSMSSPACVSAAVAVAAVYDLSLGREPNSGTYMSNFGSSFGACFDATAVPDLIACFSNRSGCNSLAAPGRLITAPGMGGGTSTFTGTSQASPHCAAVAALMSEKDFRDCNTLSVTDKITILKATGVPTSDPCATTPNPIRIDALAAMAAVLLKGDMNADQVVTTADTSIFVNVLIGADILAAHIVAADTNCDGFADGRDVRNFVKAMIP